MPPVMGAAAFLMAEFVGVPYIEVVKAAVIPALLYYIGVWIGVHYEAKKFGLKGTPRDQLPKFGKLFMEKGHLIFTAGDHRLLVGIRLYTDACCFVGDWSYSDLFLPQKIYTYQL